MSSERGAVASERDGYGRSFGSVLRATIRDYRQGRAVQARARLGFSTPPPASGRVWVRAGGDAASLRLACEVLAVLRERRKDLQLVLTFERDDRALFRRHLAPDRKLAIGWGPADWPPATRRFLQRFTPKGCVLVGSAAHSTTLAQRLDAPVFAIDHGPALASFSAARSGGPVGKDGTPQADRAWDIGASAWPSERSESATQSIADPRARFTEAQIDVTLRAIAGDSDRPLFLWLGAAAEAPRWARAFREHPLAASAVLCMAVISPVSAATGAMELVGPDPAWRAVGDATVSDWTRGALSDGAILWVDHDDWLPAVAAAVAGGYCALPPGALQWPLLAAGMPMWRPQDREPQAMRAAGQSTGQSMSEGTDPTSGLGGERSAGHARDALGGEPVAGFEVFDRWRDSAPGHFARRAAGDRARARFWAERRAVDRAFAGLQDWVWAL